MKSSHRKFLSAIAVTLSLVTGGVARADQSTVGTAPASLTEPQGNAPPALTVLSNAGLLPTGNFAGTIVDLSCDSVRPSGGNARCDTGEHYFALKMDGEGALYPLILLGSPPSGDRLRAGDFTGRKVRISGVRHASTGTILVSEIHPLG